MALLLHFAMWWWMAPCLMLRENRPSQTASTVAVNAGEITGEMLLPSSSSCPSRLEAAVWLESVQQREGNLLFHGPGLFVVFGVTITFTLKTTFCWRTGKGASCSCGHSTQLSLIACLIFLNLCVYSMSLTSRSKSSFSHSSELDLKTNGRS